MSLSDHVPVRATVASKAPSSAEHKKIPKWVTKHPLFAPKLSAFQNDADLQSLSPYDRLAKHKELIHTAAKQTPDACLSKRVSTTEEKVQVLMQAGRAVHYGLSHMVPRIIKSLPALGQFFQCTVCHANERTSSTGIV